MHGKVTDSSFTKLCLYISQKTLLVGLAVWKFAIPAISILVASSFFSGQKILLGLSPEEDTAADLNVQTELVSFTDLGGVKPSVVAENCAATVQVNLFIYNIKIGIANK